MSEKQQTHREVKTPQISARYLADYMAGSERARRTIVRNCKYQAIARVIQHDEAKLVIGKYLRDSGTDTSVLLSQAQAIRERATDSDFDKDLFNHNAGYIERFASIYSEIDLPNAERIAPGIVPPLTLHGVKVNVELQFRLRRLTKTTNQIRVGAVMLRYAKGKSLPLAVGEWQSAYLHGYLKAIGVDEGAVVDHKLCVTIDAYTGKLYSAPTNSSSRFKNMLAACESIAERWPAIKPPPGAVLQKPA